jgi:hypothetical protein
MAPSEQVLHGVAVIGMGRIGLVHATNVLLYNSKLQLRVLVGECRREERRETKEKSK